MSDKWDERKLISPEILELLARQLSELSFRENQSQVNFPTGFFQSRRRDQRVAPVMSFADENNCPVRTRKKLLDGRGHAGAGAINQRFDFPAPGKRGLFCVAHSGGAYDW